MNVKVLVENNSQQSFCGEHGLSLYVEYGNRAYLVDTGASGLFADNAEKMGVELDKIKAAFLSHAHFDHSGGFPRFFEENTAAKVYLQETCRQKYYYKIAGPVKKYIGIPKGILDTYSNRFEYVNGRKEIEKGICILPHSLKDFSDRAKRTHMCTVVDNRVEYDDFSHEQTIVFEEEDGLVCFNSCSHAGVDNIMDEIRTAFPDKKIKAFFGGFHMMGPSGADSAAYSREETEEVAARLMQIPDTVFYSGHCTGSIAFAWLKSVLGDRLAAMASGAEFEL
ncbi:MAG: MBL fold metallo-hydrolase [Eubacterium sp.]|nr:MBL fold metallo-hydrolase [Eubacterium sp.]